MLPPPLPESAHGSSSSGSSRKRKRTQLHSQASSVASSADGSRRGIAFSSATRDKVKRLNSGDACWHCGASPVDVCHIITKNNRQFELNKSAGLLNIDSLADDANAVPLCPLCHRNFDDLINPGFIFFPCDIVFFETFEQADFRRRRERYFTTRTPVQRITPTGVDYRAHQLRAGRIEEDVNGGLYQRYMLYDYLPKYRCCAAVNRVGQVFEAAPWHGDPMAALHRSFAALSSTVLRGLPLDKRMELQELQNLYIQNDASYMTPGAQDEHLDHPGSPRHSFESSGGFPGSHGHAYR
ncbi:hypothetical protein H2201_009295, partial [Coniosporium apollinis]